MMRTIGNCFLLLLMASFFSNNVFSQSLIWKKGCDGWIFTKNDNGNYQKFFAIGSWHLPGYVFTKAEESVAVVKMKNATLFKEKSASFNMIFVSPHELKDYMADKIQILNPCSPILHNYLNNIPELPKKDDKDYYRSQFLKKEVNRPEFEHYLDKKMDSLVKSLPIRKHIYSHIDEIALGGISNWFIPPTVGKKLYKSIIKNDPGSLVFVDLVGQGKGSTFFFEKNYLTDHKTMPADPPYKLLRKEYRNIPKKPLLGFSQAYDGTPVYKMINGNYTYNDYDSVKLRSMWYQNILILAKAYKDNGSVFSINAFRDFYKIPELAGITVDALKAGTGGCPVWLYFDGNGYAKPGNVSAVDYVNNVKCQIYTSIIHGATGILFWNDWKKSPEVFDTLQTVLKELRKNLDIIYLNTVETKQIGDIHLMIKKGANSVNYIIATNTNIHKSAQLNYGKIKIELSPLEVYIKQL
ncbi:MAG: hypothetical protein ACK5NK_13155 [Niabella sp.]